MSAGEIYRKVRALGSGSIATVYEGWDEQLSRAVAIKELSHRFAGDRDFVERFLAGARKMAEISHPHVLAIHHVDLSHETPWLIMELADGGTLKEAMLAGPMQPEQASQVLRQALLGLAAVHRHGVVHRHVQPDNIFRCRKTYKLGDFGVPRTAQDPELQTLSFSVPKYLSPEELTQTQAIRPASDLYALGLVVYELLVGPERLRQEVERLVRTAGAAPPVEAPAAEDENRLWLAFHLSPAELPPVGSVAPYVPAALSAILQRMLRKDAAARYQSAEQVLAELSGTGGEHASDVGPGRTQPLPQRKQRKLSPVKVAALAVGGLLLLAAAILFLLPSRSAKVAITSEPPGAVVWYRQQRVGVTPLAERVKLGTELTFRKQGFREARVKLAGAGQKTLHAVLEPLPKPSPPPPAPPPAAVPLTDAAALAAALRPLATADDGLELALAAAPGQPLQVPVGVALTFHLRSDRPAHGVLFVLSPDGTVYRLYPGPERPAPVEIPPQAPVVLPRAEDRADGFNLVAGEPAGPHIAYLLAAEEALPAVPAGEAADRWLTLHRLLPGESNPAADFVRWVVELRRRRPETTRLAVLPFEVTPAGPAGLP